MDVNLVRRRLRSFIRAHRTAFDHLALRRYQLLEVVGLALAVNHYSSKGYDVQPTALQSGAFRINTNSRGKPWNFSRWIVSRNGIEFEIYANLPVGGAYRSDGAVYVVDVAVVPTGFVPTVRPQTKWTHVDNRHLVTFAESKALVVYPMLIAQFIGICHELMPRHLGGVPRRRFIQGNHFKPALISLGYLHAVSLGIVAAFPGRQYTIGVVSNSDARLLGRKLLPGEPSAFD